MAGKFFLTESQVARLRQLINWYENVGRHFTGPGFRQQNPRHPVIYQIGKATETIASSGFGDIQAWVLASTDGSTDAFTAGSTAEIEEAWDWFGTGATTGDEVMMWRHQQSGRLVFQRSDRRVTGLLKGSLAASSTAATLDNISAIIGVSPTTNSTSTLVVANTHNWPGSDNGLARAEWHGSNARWELYQVTCATSGA